MATSLFELDPNSEQNVYNYFGVRKEKVDQDVQIVQKWLKTQTHLPEIMRKDKIRNFLILTKFNIKKAKDKIDAYYSLRRLMPNFFRDNNPNCARMLAANKDCIWGVLPKHLNGIFRVHFFKLRRSGKLKTYESAIQFFNILEMRLQNDYLAGDIIFADCSETSFRDCLKVTPVFLINMLKIYQNIFSVRLKHLHLLNTPPSISMVLNLLKTVMKPKLFQRITECKDDSYLRELLSDDEIPSDYGGKGFSVQELNNILLKEFFEHQGLFEKLETFAVQ